MRALDNGLLHFDYRLGENSKLGYRFAIAQAWFDNLTDFSIYKIIQLKVRSNSKKLYLELCSDSVKDYGYHRSKDYLVGESWQILNILISELYQLSWAKKVPLDITRIKGLQINALQVANESGWIEVEYVRMK